MKMTLADFILAYLDNNPANLEGLRLECNKCPLREACGKSADDGDNRSCIRFIVDNLES